MKLDAIAICIQNSHYKHRSWQLLWRKVSSVWFLQLLVSLITPILFTLCNYLKRMFTLILFERICLNERVVCRFHVATIWWYFRFARFQILIDLSTEFLRNYYVDVDDQFSAAGPKLEENENWANVGYIGQMHSVYMNMTTICMCWSGHRF